MGKEKQNKTLSRESFRKVLFQKIIPLQILSLVALGIIYSLKSNGSYELYLKLILIWLIFQAGISFFFGDRVNQRLKDLVPIYSSFKRVIFTIFELLFFPFLFVWEVYLLATYEKLDNSVYLKKLTLGFFLVPFQFALTFSNFDSVTPYRFVASQVNPSSGYILTVWFESQDLFEIKAKHADEISKSILNHINGEKLTSSGLVLSTALFTYDVYQKGKRQKSLTDEKEERERLSIESVHDLVENNLVVLNKMESAVKSPIEISRGFQLFHPGTLIELGLLEYFETDTMLGVKKDLLQKVSSLHIETGEKIKGRLDLEKKYSKHQEKLNRDLASIKE